jgi:S-methylmethionine-dependent homocysteine/selenocysteine methylase
MPPTPRALPSTWLLDGATGTELERRGFSTRLPLWTATAPRDCPDLLAAIHRDYVTAGADIITACTFRTSRHTLAKAGRERDAVSLTRDAVAIARSVLPANRPVLVAGSVAPLEDCYFPDRTPPARILDRAHHDHVDALVLAGVDLLLVETMPTVRESLAAVRAASRSGLPVIVSWVVRDDGVLLDGSPLLHAVEQVGPFEPAVVSVNCASVAACGAAVATLATCGLPFGAYANSGTPDGTFGFQPAPLDTEVYALHVARWLALGATMAGGCCGTTPDHIARLRKTIDHRASFDPTGQPA